MHPVSNSGCEAQRAEKRLDSFCFRHLPARARPCVHVQKHVQIIIADKFTLHCFQRRNHSFVTRTRRVRAMIKLGLYILVNGHRKKKDDTGLRVFIFASRVTGGNVRQLAQKIRRRIITHRSFPRRDKLTVRDTKHRWTSVWSTESTRFL